MSLKFFVKPEYKFYVQVHLSVFHEVVKQMVNDIGSEDTNTDAVCHLLCLPLHPYIKCQNNRPPNETSLITRKLIKHRILTDYLFLTEQNIS